LESDLRSPKWFKDISRSLGISRMALEDVEIRAEGQGHTKRSEGEGFRVVSNDRDGQGLDKSRKQWLCTGTKKLRKDGLGMWEVYCVWVGDHAEPCCPVSVW
jgi:hypothetical protein